MSWKGTGIKRYNNVSRNKGDFSVFKKRYWYVLCLDFLECLWLPRDMDMDMKEYCSFWNAHECGDYFKTPWPSKSTEDNIRQLTLNRMKTMLLLESQSWLVEEEYSLSSMSWWIFVVYSVYKIKTTGFKFRISVCSLGSSHSSFMRL